MNGWIKLHRKFKQWEWYRDTNVKCLFIHLLLEANTEQKNWKGICDVERGQLVTSVEKLRLETGLSTQEIRTALEKLTKTHEINKQSNKRFTLITICNYDSYQDFEENSNKQSNNKTTNIATNRATTTKEERRKNNIIYDDNAHTRESQDQEDDDIDNDIQQLKASHIWIEQICMKHRIIPEELDAIFEAFAAECRCNGLKRHQNLKDSQSHFNNWLRIYKQQHQNGTASKSSYQRTSPSDNIEAAQRAELERTAAIISQTKI